MRIESEAQEDGGAHEEAAADPRYQIIGEGAVAGHAGSDAALHVWKIEPDFYAAEVRAFGADGSGDSGAQNAGWADVTRELRKNFADLRDLVHRRLVNLFLGVEAGAHGPFVEQMKERAGLHQADRFCIG